MCAREHRVLESTVFLYLSLFRTKTHCNNSTSFELGCTHTIMSYHDLYPFDPMADEDFFDEIDDQNYDGGVADDVGLDEYEMVCFFAFLFSFWVCFFFLS